MFIWNKVSGPSINFIHRTISHRKEEAAKLAGQIQTLSTEKQQAETSLEAHVKSANEEMSKTQESIKQKDERIAELTQKAEDEYHCAATRLVGGMSARWWAR